jgi:hypothetical protein
MGHLPEIRPHGPNRLPGVESVSISASGEVAGGLVPGPG